MSFFSAIGAFFARLFGGGRSTPPPVRVPSLPPEPINLDDYPTWQAVLETLLAQYKVTHSVDATPVQVRLWAWRLYVERWTIANVLKDLKGEQVPPFEFAKPTARQPQDYLAWQLNEGLAIENAYVAANVPLDVRAMGWASFFRLSMLKSLANVIHVIKKEPEETEPNPGVPGDGPRVTRTGVCRAEGQQLVDDQGAFYPLGGTLFWTLRGWKYERDRIKENIGYYGRYGYDYIRILGQVDWKDNDIRETWDDYETLLAEAIDYAYDTHGIRTALTLIGGQGVDTNLLVDKVIRVVSARAHKVIYLEVANEWYQNFTDLDAMKRIGRRLREALPNLVALSSPGEDPPIDLIKSFVRDRSVSNMATVHLERDDTKNEWKWRHVRKPWESRGPGFFVDHNEPGGPRSSVAEFPEPIHLVMSRLVGIMTGLTGYVLHNGSGIFGVPQPERNRQANVWETGGIDDCMRAVRRLDSILPAGLGDGLQTRKGQDRHVLEADSIWSDGFDHGVTRDYISNVGNTFVQALQGIKDYVILTAHARVRLRLIDPVTFEEETTTLETGQQVRVEPKTRDARGLGARIIIGERF